MKVLLCYSTEDSASLRYPIHSLEHIHFGISSIAAVLKQQGVEVELLVLSSSFSFNKNRSLTFKTLQRFKPDIVAYTAVSTQYPFISKMNKVIKKKYGNITTVLGGAHVSLVPESVIHDPFDILCIGEGEYALLDLVKSFQDGTFKTDIPNLWFIKGSTVIKNPTRPFLHDLDSLPFPDRSIWKEWLSPQQNRLSLLLGRGCPYQCTYCSNHKFRKLAEGNYIRYRSVPNIIYEIRLLLNEYPSIRHYYLEVETLTINKEWFIALCCALESLNKTIAVPLIFGTNYRVSHSALDPLLFEAMQNASIRSINIGLESGSERVRKEILKRPYTNEQFLQAVHMAQSHGLDVNLYNLIGVPTETWDEFQETIILNRLAKPTATLTSIFYPYPGTELHTMSLERGYIKSNLRPTRERRHSVLRMPQFSPRQIKRAHLWFDYYVYKNVKPQWLLLLKVFYLWLLSNQFSLTFINAVKRMTRFRK